jgi:hypothetical protein
MKLRELLKSATEKYVGKSFKIAGLTIHTDGSLWYAAEIFWEKNFVQQGVLSSKIMSCHLHNASSLEVFPNVTRMIEYIISNST